MPLDLDTIHRYALFYYLQINICSAFQSKIPSNTTAYLVLSIWHSIVNLDWLASYMTWSPWLTPSNRNWNWDIATIGLCSYRLRRSWSTILGGLWQGCQKLTKLTNLFKKQKKDTEWRRRKKILGVHGSASCYRCLSLILAATSNLEGNL